MLRFMDTSLYTNNFVIEVAGCRFWVKPEGGLLIGDIEVPDECDVMTAIDELKQVARARGLTKIVFQASPGTHLERVFSSQYPSFDSWLLGYLSFGSSFPLDQIEVYLR